MDDLRRDEGLVPEPTAEGEPDGAEPPDDLNVSPASPGDLDDGLPDYQPGEGPGPTPGQ